MLGADMVFLSEQDPSDDVPLITRGEREASRNDEIEIEHSLEAPDEFSGSHKRFGITEIDRKELLNIFLLFTLYCGQGVLIGLVGGTVPTILKSSLSYGDIGLFSIAFYPFSLKLLWSPLVDALWFERVGQRKTWIVPSLLVTGLALLALGWTTIESLERIKESQGKELVLYVGIWFVIIFISASQSCAADGWTVSLLSSRSLHWASSAHNLGSVCGEFISYALFFFIFSKTGDKGAPGSKDSEIASLGKFMMVFGVLFCAQGLYLAVFKKEDRAVGKTHRSVIGTYKSALTLLRHKPVQSVIVVHLLARIGFEVNDTATNLKLLDKGFGTENIAMVTTIDLPFDVICSFVAGALCASFLPLHIWSWAFIVRLLTALVAQSTIMIYPQGSIPAWYYATVVLGHVLSTSTSTIMFVAFLAFHLRVADPSVGGVYMTLLATAQNLGGTLPRAGVMRLIQVATYSNCSLAPNVNNAIDPSKFPLSCAVPADREYCEGHGGICSTIIDGYYVANLLCVIVGGLIFVLYIRPTINRLEKLPRSQWLLKR